METAEVSEGAEAGGIVVASEVGEAVETEEGEVCRPRTALRSALLGPRGGASGDCRKTGC